MRSQRKWKEKQEPDKNDQNWHGRHAPKEWHQHCYSLVKDDWQCQGVSNDLSQESIHYWLLAAQEINPEQTFNVDSMQNINPTIQVSPTEYETLQYCEYWTDQEKGSLNKETTIQNYNPDLICKSKNHHVSTQCTNMKYCTCDIVLG